MLIQFLLVFVNALFTILIWAIVARAVLSWFPMGPGNPFQLLAVILNQITEPVLAPFRRIIPTVGMFDISPLVALIILQILQTVLERALMSAARSF